MLCALLLLCYYTFLTFILGSAVPHPYIMCIWDSDDSDFVRNCHLIPHIIQHNMTQHLSFFILSGTGEGEVAEAERLLKPFRLRYPRVSSDEDSTFSQIFPSTHIVSLFFLSSSRILKIFHILITFMWYSIHLPLMQSLPHPESLHHLSFILHVPAHLHAITPTAPLDSHSCKFTIPVSTPPFTCMPAHPREQTQSSDTLCTKPKWKCLSVLVKHCQE